MIFIGNFACKIGYNYYLTIWFNFLSFLNAMFAKLTTFRLLL
jgi:hypothetical protein